jgi:hypothetical protein
LPFPAKARGIWKARLTPPQTMALAIHRASVRDKVTGGYFYFLAACAVNDV